MEMHLDIPKKSYPDIFHRGRKEIPKQDLSDYYWMIKCLNEITIFSG